MYWTIHALGRVLDNTRPREISNADFAHLNSNEWRLESRNIGVLEPQNTKNEPLKNIFKLNWAIWDVKIGELRSGSLVCSFKSYKSNATTSRMAREYWEMRSHASGCIANNALIGRNAFLSMQPSLRSCCIGNALLPIRALFAMQPSAFERISQYSLAILDVVALLL